MFVLFWRGTVCQGPVPCLVLIIFSMTGRPSTCRRGEGKDHSSRRHRHTHLTGSFCRCVVDEFERFFLCASITGMQHRWGVVEDLIQNVFFLTDLGWGRMNQTHITQSKFLWICFWRVFTGSASGMAVILLSRWMRLVKSHDRCLSKDHSLRLVKNSESQLIILQPYWINMNLLNQKYCLDWWVIQKFRKEKNTYLSIVLAGAWSSVRWTELKGKRFLSDSEPRFRHIFGWNMVHRRKKTVCPTNTY